MFQTCIVKRTGGKASTAEFPERLAGIQAETDQVIKGGHRVTFFVRPKAGGMEAHHELVQTGVRGAGTTVKRTLGLHCNRKGGVVQVQTT